MPESLLELNNICENYILMGRYSESAARVSGPACEVPAPRQPAEAPALRVPNRACQGTYSIDLVKI